MDNDNAWIQCESSKCLKWRKIPKHILESVSNISWYCNMNPDKTKAFCDYKQEHMGHRKGEQFIYSVLEEGSLVWARLPGYPSWPAIICSDVIQNNFSSYDHDGDLKHYHVEYFGEPRLHSWVLAKNVDVYGSGSAPAPSVLAGSKGMASARARKSFEKAIIQADSMTRFKPKERLKFCTFKLTEDQIENTEGKSGEETPLKIAPDEVNQTIQHKGRKRRSSIQKLEFSCCKELENVVEKGQKKRRRRSKNVPKVSLSLTKFDDTKLTDDSSLPSFMAEPSNENLSHSGAKEVTPISSSPGTNIIPSKISSFHNSNNLSCNNSTLTIKNMQKSPGVLALNPQRQILLSFVPNTSVIPSGDTSRFNESLKNTTGQLVPVSFSSNKQSNSQLHSIFSTLYKQDCNNQMLGNGSYKNGLSLPKALLVNALKAKECSKAKTETSAGGITKPFSKVSTISTNEFSLKYTNTKEENLGSEQILSNAKENTGTASNDNKNRTSIDGKNHLSKKEDEAKFTDGANNAVSKESHSMQNIKALEEKNKSKEDNEEEDIIDCLMGYSQKQLSKSDYQEFDFCLDEMEELQNEIKNAEEILCTTEASPQIEVSTSMDISQSKNNNFAEDFMKEMDEVEGSIAMLSKLL